MLWNPEHYQRGPDIELLKGKERKKGQATPPGKLPESGPYLEPAKGKDSK